MDTSDVLLACRDALREHGWTRHTLRGPDSRICLLGALDTVDGTVCETKDALGAYGHLIRFCRHEHGFSPAIVNDIVLTSEDEACDLLEAAAKWDGESGG